MSRTAEARRKEQEQHARDCETARAVILRDQPDHADLLMEALGLTEHESARGPRKPMRRPPDIDRMRALREAGHSLAEIGERVGLHKSTVGDHLNGRTYS